MAIDGVADIVHIAGNFGKFPGALGIAQRFQNIRGLHSGAGDVGKGVLCVADGVHHLVRSADIGVDFFIVFDILKCYHKLAFLPALTRAAFDVCK